MEEIKEKLIEEELKEAYIDYAMSVIVGRALPDVRDGLKPIHRRILFVMHKLGLTHDKPFRKSATVVGSTMSMVHPHGDIPIYDALVRMAQDFSLRYPLVEGQGNFGSIDGDSPAATRYTEARLAKISQEMLADIEKDTVDFVPNYDGTLKEPVVLPAKLPNLLLNGSSGIAVGMATNIPPHNLREVADAIVALIDNRELSVEDLMSYIKGPDFPTGGIICGVNGIIKAYTTGRGTIKIKSKTHIEEIKGKKSIVITEIPYMVNKSSLLEEIATLIREKKIEGITDIRDESDREGIRVVLELKPGTNPDVLLNQLFKHTQLKTSFGIIMLALYNGQPSVMNLKRILTHYIQHRKEVIERRTKFDLDKAEKRAHILEGLKIALINIDPIVKLIKSSKNVDEARNLLVKKFSLTNDQANAILDMKLQKLTSLEQNKIQKEHEELKKRIKELKEILSEENKIYEIIKKEVIELKEKYGDERRTQIIEEEEEIDVEDLIPKKNIVIVATKSGYIKRMPLNLYKGQKRGGKGIKGAETKEEDVIEHLFTANTHSTILFFTNKGKVYSLKAYKIPEASRYSKGKAIVNLLKLEKGELINTMIPIEFFDDFHYLIMVTKKGIVKKTKLNAFSNIYSTGIRAIKLLKDDELVQVRLTPGSLKFIIGTKKGFALKFDECDVRPMGRNATGVRGIKLAKNDEVVGIEVSVERGGYLLAVTEKGYGKKTPIKDYRLVRRGGKGVINMKIREKNGNVVGIKTVMDHDEILITTIKGQIIRLRANEISTLGRNTQGVRLIRLNQGDRVGKIARVIKYL